MRYSRLSAKEKAKRRNNMKNAFTKERRKRMSEFAKTRVGAKNPFYGKKHKKDTIEKIQKSTKITKSSDGYIEPCAKSIIVDEVRYNSIREASEATGVLKATIGHRARSKNYRNVYYECEGKPEPKSVSRWYVIDTGNFTYIGKTYSELSKNINCSTSALIKYYKESKPLKIGLDSVRGKIIKKIDLNCHD